MGEERRIAQKVNIVSDLNCAILLNRMPCGLRTNTLAELN